MQIKFHNFFFCPSLLISQVARLFNTVDTRQLDQETSHMVLEGKFWIIDSSHLLLDCHIIYSAILFLEKLIAKLKQLRDWIHS